MNFQNAIVFFTGFLQSEADRNGFEDGYFELIRNIQCNSTLTYAPRTWTTNVKHLADQLRRQGIQRVAMVSYSHGQAAAVAFAKYAYKIGLAVDLWVACDPVNRSTWLPRKNWAQVFAWKALFKHGEIKVPHNVTRTVYIRQDKDWPRGHDLVAESIDQTIDCVAVMHSYGHQQIDESPTFWNLATTELSHWVNPKKAIPINE